MGKKRYLSYGQHKLQSAIMPFNDGAVLDAAFNEKAKIKPRIHHQHNTDKSRLYRQRLNKHNVGIGINVS
jgi:hypothetical protein